jgi:hypothetical protein
MREGDGGRCSLYLSSTTHILPRGIEESAVTHAGGPRGVTPFVSADSQYQEHDGVSHHYKIMWSEACAQTLEGKESRRIHNRNEKAMMALISWQP